MLLSNSFRLQRKRACRHSSLTELSLDLRGNWLVYTVAFSLHQQLMNPQPHSAIWLCPSPLLLLSRLRKRGAQSGPANWWSWLARKTKARSEKKPKEKEGREEEEYIHTPKYTAAHLLISTATVFTRSQTSGRRPGQAVSPALEEGGKRIGWEAANERTSLHYPPSIMF